MVFERRSRIASVYQVILTPCMSGRLIEVGKNWLLAFFWSMLVLTWRESGSIEKHNGLCPPSQNPLCFTGRRDCVAATCKTMDSDPTARIPCVFQWIVTCQIVSRHNRLIYRGDSAPKFRIHCISQCAVTCQITAGQNPL